MASNPEDSSLQLRQISVRFNVTNPDNTEDSIELTSGYRITADLTETGMHAGASAVLKIYGLSLDNMNRLSFMGDYQRTQAPTISDRSHSIVEIQAGIKGKALSTVFTGQITNAYADYSSAPDIPFYVEAQSTSILSRHHVGAISSPGSHSISKLLHNIAFHANITLVDHGGWDTLPAITDSYIDGSILNQLTGIVRATHGVYQFVPAPKTKNSKPTAGVLNVWGPNYQASHTKTIPLISNETGLIGYPSYASGNCTFKCIFRPEIAYYKPIMLKSNYLPAHYAASDSSNKGKRTPPWNGTWLPINIRHSLTSEVPSGEWETSITCIRTVESKKHDTP